MDNFKREFWKYFKDISDIPRKSGEEKNISTYLINFAKNRNLKYYTDDLYNVVIWKEASSGYEYDKVLGLQCHIDMICEKIPNSTHDFSNDPIKLITDGDYLKADETTLGADNGIGIAYILAILDSKFLKAPKLECIFTTQEETTMNGAIALDASILQSKQIISFDNFNETEMWIGSASAKEWTSEIVTKKYKLDSNFSTYLLDLSGFKGGHSGIDIEDNSRGNPIKIISELLHDFSTLYIHEFIGGTAVNVIPRNCKIVFSISNHEAIKIEKLKQEINKIKEVFSNATIIFEQIDTTLEAFNEQTSKNIIDFIYNFKNGKLEIDSYGNVILSGNFAGIKTENNKITLLYSIRDNFADLGKNLESKIRLEMDRCGIIENTFVDIPGYEQTDNSELIKKCEKEYLEFFNKPIKKVRKHVCLECGYFSEKIPNLQFVAIAPNIYDTHSPNERMSIKSANMMWDFIIKLLENSNNNF